MITKIFSRLILLGSVITALQGPTFAQGRQYGYLKQANLLFRHQDYASAAQYYERFLRSQRYVNRQAVAASGQTSPFAVRKQGPTGRGSWNSKCEILFRLAECYRLCHDYTRAEAAYANAVDSCTPPDPLAEYWYGVSLRANGKYQQAMEAFSLFEQKYDRMDVYLTGADLEIKNLRFIMGESRRGVRDSFVLHRQDLPGMNSAYAASELAEDSIVFTGISGGNGGGFGRAGAYMNRLYRAYAIEGNAVAPLELATHAEVAMHDGMASFSADRQRMYFTRWSDAGGKHTGTIFETHHTDTGWTRPAKLEMVNEDGFSSAQPFIVESPDGYYLLFSSNRPDGIGNYDLWTAWLDSAYHVIRVANMGNTINTPGDEVSPYFHKNSRTLIFSTNGRPGAGGFDICFANGNIGLSKWQRPENYGLAINSSRDDMYFYSSDTLNCWNTGWFSSDRESDCCLALYSFRQINEQIIKGSVVDCKTGRPLEGVSLLLQPGGRKAAIENKTGPDGQYRFELHNTSWIRISASLSGYRDTALSLTLRFKSVSDTFALADICLKMPEPTPQPVFDSSTHQLGGFRYRDYTLSADCRSRLDSIAVLMTANAALMLELDGYTDGRGGRSYNLILAARRVEACVDYLVEKGIDKSRLVARAMGKCCPLYPERVNGKDDPVARQKNRRVEYKFISNRI